MRLLRQCAAIGRRDLAVQRSYGISAWLGVLAALLGLVSYHFIGRLVGAEGASSLPGGSFFTFVWTGLAVQLLVAASLGALGGSLAREAAEGTLEVELAAGASPLALAVGGVIAPLVLAACQLGAHGLAGVLLFDVQLDSVRAGPLLFALAFTVLACAPIGLLGAALWMIVRRASWFTTASLFALGLFGGVYFPVALLPEPLDAASRWLPLTVGLDAVRATLLEGAGWSETAGPILRLGGMALLGLPPTVALLNAAAARAERRGLLSRV